MGGIRHSTALSAGFHCASPLLARSSLMFRTIRGIGTWTVRYSSAGAFESPPKDAVYVNQAKAGVAVSDPTKTKVASHEFTHIVLNKREATQGEHTQHEILGRLGWNHTPGENHNWATPPGEGLPK